MSIVGFVIFAIILVAVCYTSVCIHRVDGRNLPREIQRELEPFSKQNSA